MIGLISQKSSSEMNIISTLGNLFNEPVSFESSQSIHLKLNFIFRSSFFFAKKHFSINESMKTCIMRSKLSLQKLVIYYVSNVALTLWLLHWAHKQRLASAVDVKPSCFRRYRFDSKALKSLVTFAKSM